MNNSDYFDMFVQQPRFGNYSSGDNSDEDVSEGDVLQVNNFIATRKVYCFEEFVHTFVKCSILKFDHVSECVHQFFIAL